ncbi:MAG: 30S ribosomal protein S3 [Candidatus Lokiarchaeota archaeon]|nr:30S ribosomal protein S3 [Candidatus Lokiarchaeota archaeon]
MVNVKRLFAIKAREQMELQEYFRKNLDGVGFAGLDIQKTPLGTRVTIKAARPGLVIGKKGANVKGLTEVLARDFKIENPQIDVDEVRNPELDGYIMAERLASALEKGQHYRRAGYGLLRRIMRAGAEGAEIIITGKITSQRARYQKMRQGAIKRCGDPVKHVSHGVAHAKLKSGILGIRINILPKGYDNPKDVLYLGSDKLSPEFMDRITPKEEPEVPVPLKKGAEPSAEVVEVEAPAEEASGRIKGKLPGVDDVLETDDANAEALEEELEEDGAAEAENQADEGGAGADEDKVEKDEE